ncbi:MAG: hypothetical protein NTX40_01355, partial [Planctomycetota bacterium]|nr:hypothetical protein [Planctomycetota bacterium]
PFVELAGEGDGPAVRIAWGEAVGDLAAEMIRLCLCSAKASAVAKASAAALRASAFAEATADKLADRSGDKSQGYGGQVRRGAAPLAIQLAPGAPGEAMAKAYRRAVAGARLRVEENLIGPAEQADGPAGWRWAESLLADGSVRGFILAGAEPEGALAALAQHAARIPDEVAVAVWAPAGAAPAFVREPARLELDAREIVQAGSEMLLVFARGEPAADVTIRPRFIPGETLPPGGGRPKR